MMVIYAKGAVGDAWQYTGDIDSMPDWVQMSPNHHIEIRENGDICMWTGNTCLLVDKSDWFVKFCDGTVALYNDNTFKMNFTFSDPAKAKTDSVASKKYREIAKTVDAWQYTGKIVNSELPPWVFDLILYNRLGYRPGVDDLATKNIELRFRFRADDGIWVPLSVRDWLVRYGDDSLYKALSDADFKKSFEEIK